MHGELGLGRETRKPQHPWRAPDIPARYSLCRGCFEWASNLMAVAAARSSDAKALGVPIGHPEVQVTDQHCAYCASELLLESFVVDIVPNSREYVRSSLFRHVGVIRQQRLCGLCEAWWLSVLHDGSAMRGSSMRREEGPMGGWLAHVAFDAAAIFLLQRDAFVVQETVSAQGHQFAQVTPHVARELEGGVLVAGAGRRDRVSRLLGHVPPERLRATFVVGRPDCMHDAAAAMRLGAGELLASPLSPQQIAGAFERLVELPALEARGPALGLPILREGEPRQGVPCHLLLVRLPREEHVEAAALLLRRFLRGHDRVGEDGNGALAAMVYCEDVQIGGVLNRLRVVFRERAVITVSARFGAEERAAA